MEFSLSVKVRGLTSKHFLSRHFWHLCLSVVLIKSQLLLPNRQIYSVFVKTERLKNPLQPSHDWTSQVFILCRCLYLQSQIHFGSFLKFLKILKTSLNNDVHLIHERRFDTVHVPFEGYFYCPKFMFRYHDVSFIFAIFTISIWNLKFSKLRWIIQRFLCSSRARRGHPERVR